MGEVGVDVVIESTGKFLTTERCNETYPRWS